LKAEIRKPNISTGRRISFGNLPHVCQQFKRLSIDRSSGQEACWNLWPRLVGKRPAKKLNQTAAFHRYAQ
jgi:hypothetical protein